MKNNLLTNLKTITSYVLALSIIVSSFGFVPTIQAAGEPTLTIGSQVASNGAAINVPINASNFANAVAGIDFSVPYDPTLLTYTGLTQNAISGHGTLTSNDNANTIIINWFDTVALGIDSGTILTLNFTVISATTTNADLTFTGSPGLSNSLGDPISPASFVNGVITLNPAKAITAFSFATPAATGVINEGAKTIAIEVPFNTTVTALVPTIAVSAGASVSPLSGVANNFTSPQTYTVTSADSSTQAYVVTVTIAANPDIALVAADKAALVDGSIKGANPDLSNITVALTNPLPSSGSNGSTITWASNNTSVVSNNGQTVHRPAYGAGNATVTMTATIAKGAVTDTKVFTLTVLAETLNPDIALVAADKAALVDGSIKGANPDLSNITVALTNPLPSLGSNGSAITWASNNTSVVSNNGQTVNRPAYGAGNATVTMTATITKGAVTDTKVFTLTVLAETLNPDIALVAADKAALVDGSIKGANPDLSNVTVALTNPLPSFGSINGSTITWASNNTNVISNDGQTINRPAFASGNTTVTMTATITKGVVTVTKVFTLTVIKLPASTIATVTSGTYTVGADTITNIPFGISKATFLAALTKGQANQTWNTASIADPVVTGNTLVVTAQDGTTTATYIITTALNPARAITTFNFPEGVGTINETAHTIAVTVPFGTAVTALVPTIVITGASINPASGAAQNFTFPVTYTVTAADSSTQAYVVTVTIAQNTAKAITSFNFASPSATGVVNETAKTVSITVPYATDVTALVPTIAISGSSISPLSGVAQDFTNPVTYTVAAANSSTQAYVVTVIFAPNPAKAITAFNFSEGSGTINEITHTIAVTVPFGTSLTALVPTIAITGASISPLSEVAQNFTSPVTYTVTAADSSTQAYVVTVTVGADPIIAVFEGISNTLSTAGIVNNLNTVSSSNYTSFSGLYFEKRTNAADATTAIGRITFNSALDLSNNETKTFLQNLGAKMDANSAGTIGLDFTGATNSLALKETSATIKFYGLNALGFGADSTASEINSKLIAFDDSGNLLNKSTLIPTVGTYLGACEVGGGCYVFTVDVNHFTKYKIDNTAPTNQNTVFASSTSKKGGGTVTVVSASETGGAIWFAPLGTSSFTTGSTMTTAGGTATSILAPATAGDYKLFVIDAAGNVSAASAAILTVDNTAPTVTKIGDDSTDVTIAAGATATLTFSEALSATGKTAVENALTSGANKVITYSWNGENTILTISGHATDLTTFANDVVANVTDVVGNNSVLLLIDSSLAATQIAPVTAGDGSGDVTVNSTTPEVVITNPTQVVDVAISSGTINPTINVSSFITEGTGTLPEINITSANANNTTIAIPASTIVTSADSTWNGIIAAPTVTTVAIPVTSGQTKTFSAAIEVGFTGAKLSFDKAVRILLVGQAGKRAGYIRAGITFTEIANTCAADNQAAGDALAADGDCKIDVGSDLVIWTKHFTSFATYTQTAITTSNAVIITPSISSSVGTTPPTPSIASSAGTITSSGGSITTTLPSGSSATVIVPANIFTPSSTISVSEATSAEKNSTPIAASAGVIIPNTVFNIQSSATFSQPVTLEFVYDPAQLGSIDPNTLSISYFSTTENKWVSLPSSVNTTTRKVSAQTIHFTLFAITTVPTTSGSTTTNTTPTTPPSTPLVDKGQVLGSSVGVYPNGTLLKAPDSKAVWYISGDQKHLIPSAAVFESRFNWADIVKLPSSRQIDLYEQDGNVLFAVGALVKEESKSAVYRVSTTQGKQPILSAEVFLARGYEWNQVIEVAPGFLANYPEQAYISEVANFYTGDVVKLANTGKIYQIETGAARLVPNVDILQANALDKKPLRNVTAKEFKQFVAGTDIFYPDGTLVKGSSSAIYIISNGRKRAFASGADFDALLYNRKRIKVVADKVLAGIESVSPIRLAQKNIHTTSAE